MASAREAAWHQWRNIGAAMAAYHQQRIRMYERNNKATYQHGVSMYGEVARLK